ncbi:MAG: hypothetical protein WAX89_04895 [Alphaproteobacteria bacterium]
MKTPIKSLSDSKLEAMIAHAVARPQLPAQTLVVRLAAPLQWGALAAMAASIALAVGLAPLQPTASLQGDELEMFSQVLMYESL